MTLTEALKKSKIKPENVNMSLLQQIWGDDKKLSKDERFLRNYILSEGWLDKNTTGLNKNLLLIDKEDEENEDKFDAFENKLKNEENLRKDKEKQIEDLENKLKEEKNEKEKINKEKEE